MHHLRMFIFECGISLARAGCLLVHVWQKHFAVFPEELRVSSLAGSQSLLLLMPPGMS